MGKEESYVCPRCGNKDPRFIGHKNGGCYCRKCISFVGAKANVLPSFPKEAPIELHYALSQEQAEISAKVISNYQNGIDTLIYAVCGAGKTELSYGVISYAISQGLQVGFALPRRDVVIELFWRLRDAFSQNKIVAVYGQHTFALEGDVVILTTHQLYRYPQYFDLLIMDEIDAFPFKDSSLLISMYKRSLKGHSVLMSATPSPEVLAEYKKPGHEILELRTRFHKKPIPVPSLVLVPDLLQPLYLIKKLSEYRKRKKPCFIFAPTIALCEEVFNRVRLFAAGGNFVHSKRPQRPKIISDFKKGKYAYLVTTSVLERGVTIRNLQIIVTHADEARIYNSSTLIQIAGRAGRKMDAPDGEVIFYGERESEAMVNARKEIRFCNTFL